MGRAVTARAADSAAPSYPDWAAAVVPAYPHARPWSSPIAARVQSKMYGLATTDLMPTVVAWYKARVHGAWSESEGGNTWSVKSGGVRIQISANIFDESGEQKPWDTHRSHEISLTGKRRMLCHWVGKAVHVRAENAPATPRRANRVSFE